MAIDLTQAHSELLKSDAEYRDAIQKTFVNRKEDLTEDFNALIDSSLAETDRNFELHVMSLDFAGLNPYSEKENFFENDNDFALAVICDNGIIILGRLANVSLNWDEISYMLEYADGSILLHLNDNTDVFFGDDNFSLIFKKLRETLTEEDEMPRFIEG